MAKEDKFADEMLTDDELDGVAGGNCYEAADDSRFLNVLLQGTKYHQCDRYGATKMFFQYSAVVDLNNAWKSLGVELRARTGFIMKNKYILNGNEITRAEAWAHAENLVGKHLTKAQWDW